MFQIVISLIYVFTQEDKLSFIFGTIIYDPILYVFLLLLSFNLQNIWNTILGSFSSFNCFFIISFFVTELVCSCSKWVSKESLSSEISNTLVTLKYSIPFPFIVLGKFYFYSYMWTTASNLINLRLSLIFHDNCFQFLLNIAIFSHKK